MGWYGPRGSCGCCCTECDSMDYSWEWRTCPGMYTDDPDLSGAENEYNESQQDIGWGFIDDILSGSGGGGAMAAVGPYDRSGTDYEGYQALSRLLHQGQMVDGKAELMSGFQMIATHSWALSLRFCRSLNLPLSLAASGRLVMLVILGGTGGYLPSSQAATDSGFASLRILATGRLRLTQARATINPCASCGTVNAM